MVKNYTLRAVAEIAEKNVKAILIACHSATSAAIVQVREKYQNSGKKIPVIGMEPAIKVGLKMIVNNQRENRILLLSTQLTKKGEMLFNLLRKYDVKNRVDTIVLSELVAYAEHMVFCGEEINQYFSKKILSLNLNQYGAIVLGCTHFVWYKELLQNLLPKHIKVVDGNEGTVRQLKNRLKDGGALSKRNDLPEILMHFTGKVNDVQLHTVEQEIGRPVSLTSACVSKR